MDMRSMRTQAGDDKKSSDEACDVRKAVTENLDS